VRGRVHYVELRLELPELVPRRRLGLRGSQELPDLVLQRQLRLLIR
jgi:hypothetical protein